MNSISHRGYIAQHTKDRDNSKTIGFESDVIVQIQQNETHKQRDDPFKMKIQDLPLGLKGHVKGEMVETQNTLTVCTSSNHNLRTREHRSHHLSVDGENYNKNQNEKNQGHGSRAVLLNRAKSVVVVTRCGTYHARNTPHQRGVRKYLSFDPF